MPLATGTGIFLLMSNLTDKWERFLGPVGAFGFVVTLGLFFYEIYGIMKCHTLIEAGKQIEGQLGMDGQFVSRPSGVARYINKPFAAGIIYPAVLAAWTYVALVFAFPQIAWLLAVLIFLLGFSFMVVYNLGSESRRTKERVRSDEVRAAIP